MIIGARPHAKEAGIPESARYGSSQIESGLVSMGPIKSIIPLKCWNLMKFM